MAVKPAAAMPIELPGLRAGRGGFGGGREVDPSNRHTELLEKFKKR